VAKSCDDFLIAVLMKGLPYKEHQKLRSISRKIAFNISFLFSKITSPNWSSCRAVHSYNSSSSSSSIDTEILVGHGLLNYH
jgi:hypothetical protein